MNAKQCQYNLAWVGQCKNIPAAGFVMCSEHENLKCVNCKKKAVRQCEHTGIQFVCGAELCADCCHGIVMPGKSSGLFAMGGGHVNKEQYLEQNKEYHRLETMRLVWKLDHGEDRSAKGKFGNYYVVKRINGDFDAIFNGKSLLPELNFYDRDTCLQICQDHNIKLCEAGANPITASWSKPWHGVTHLTKGNNVATLIVYPHFTLGFFYVRLSGQCPWTQPEHVFLPQNGIGIVSDGENREHVTHNVGAGQDHQAAAKCWAESMVGG